MVKHSLINFLNLHKIKYKLQQAFSLFHYCNMCGVPNSNLICNICYSELELIDDNTCEQCKQTLPSTHNLIYKKCISCSNNFTFFDNLYCQFRYSTPLEKVLHLFKYSKKVRYHNLLAQLFYNAIKNAPLPDIIIPIPLHKSKLKSRGFNQAEKLLYFYRVFSGSNLISKGVVTRIKDTSTQALLTKINRKNNLINAFKIRKNVKNLHIVIVDDVVTTGSTCNGLAKLLKLKGAKQVDVWCLMRTAYN